MSGLIHEHQTECPRCGEIILSAERRRHMKQTHDLGKAPCEFEGCGRRWAEMRADGSLRCWRHYGNA